MSRAEGFEPVFSENSRVLILGSFPLVKSRAVGFYYGNPQNRFWKMLCSFFGEEVPPDPEGKTAFLLRCGIALWDMVSSCEIAGSADAAIKEEQVVDVSAILRHAPIERVLCNGAKSYALFAAQCPEACALARKMPSTSPANPRYRQDVWHAALAEIFGERVFGKGIDKSARLR